MALNSDDETKQHIFNRCLTVSVKTDDESEDKDVHRERCAFAKRRKLPFKSVG